MTSQPLVLRGGLILDAASRSAERGDILIDGGVIHTCGPTGMAVPDLNWYFSYNLFRLAGITQGIAGRVRDGTAANAKALESARR